MVLTDGLISYWKLDESSGDAIDAHSDNDGTITGATQNVSGKLNTAYSFDGSDRVDISNVLADITDQDTLSISLWVKGAGQNDKIILGFCKDSAGFNNLLDIGTSNSGSFNKLRIFRYDDSAQINSTGATTILDNTNFYHIVFTCDAGTWVAYVNGVSEINGSYSPATNGFNKVFMGVTITATSYYGYFTGVVDEVGIWNRALTSDEASALYNAGSGLAYPFSTGTGLQMNIGDTWKEVSAMQINIGDTWKEVAGAQVNIGDTWKEIF